MSLDVSLRTGESQESLLLRFQKGVKDSGILREVKQHSFYSSQGEATRAKVKISARKRRRQNYKQNNY